MRQCPLVLPCHLTRIGRYSNPWIHSILAVFDAIAAGQLFDVFNNFLCLPYDGSVSWGEQDGVVVSIANRGEGNGPKSIWYRTITFIQCSPLASGACDILLEALECFIRRTSVKITKNEFWGVW